MGTCTLSSLRTGKQLQVDMESSNGEYVDTVFYMGKNVVTGKKELYEITDTEVSSMPVGEFSKNIRVEELITLIRPLVFDPENCISSKQNNSEGGIATDILHVFFIANNDTTRISKLYEMSKEDVWDITKYMLNLEAKKIPSSDLLLLINMIKEMNEKVLREQSTNQVQGQQMNPGPIVKQEQFSPQQSRHQGQMVNQGQMQNQSQVMVKQEQLSPQGQRMNQGQFANPGQPNNQGQVANPNQPMHTERQEAEEFEEEEEEIELPPGDYEESYESEREGNPQQMNNQMPQSMGQAPQNMPQANNSFNPQMNQSWPPNAGQVQQPPSQANNFGQPQQMNNFGQPQQMNTAPQNLPPQNNAAPPQPKPRSRPPPKPKAQPPAANGSEGNIAEEKPFKCEKCNFRTVHKKSLRSHDNEVHLKLKPHKCQLCDYASARKDGLKNHMVAQHKEQNNNAQPVQ